VAAPKPAEIFDRDAEWRDLLRFATDDRPGATLGAVTGRRRQGKTFLLYALAQATGGFYFGATEAVSTDSLRRLGDSLGDHLGAPAPISLADWEEALAALLRLGRERPVVVVIDEFPYLARSAKALPSVIQHAFTPGSAGRQESRTRLLLCGSAMSFMGGLLAGSAPLRGRAGLELAVRPLDYRAAATFWGAGDPRLAAQLYAVVGGTPAYRREYVQDDAPAALADFDSWVVRSVLNPALPLFREARYLLAEDPDLRDPALYHSVLAAVADGNATRGGIANYLGRRASDLAHPLMVLEDAGLLIREPDMLRSGRSIYRIAEPLITFYQSIMRPVWTQLEQRRGAEVWERSRHRFTSAVIGPTFENLVRDWAGRFASEEHFGGIAEQVGRGVLSDPAGRDSYELDVIAIGDFGQSMLAIGEAKWGRRLGIDHLRRLERARELLRVRPGPDAGRARLLLASGTGFSPDLRAAAQKRADVLLVDLALLYGVPASVGAVGEG
jgi:uncharacterized protein